MKTYKLRLKVSGYIDVAIDADDVKDAETVAETLSFAELTEHNMVTNIQLKNEYVSDVQDGV